MAFNINNFRSSFTLDPANPTNYEVVIKKRPDNLSSERKFLDYANILRYRCETCSMPNRGMKTSNRITYGPIRKIVTGAEYRDVSFSFIASDDMQEKEYFNDWHKSIVNNDDSESKYNTHDVSYYEKYTGEIEIKYFEKGGRNTYSIQLFEAYPIEIQEVPLSWSSNNEYMRITVVMAYRNFRELRLTDSELGIVPPPPVPNNIPKIDFNIAYGISLGNIIDIK